jgi:hypothetical protein
MQYHVWVEIEAEDEVGFERDTAPEKAGTFATETAALRHRDFLAHDAARTVGFCAAAMDRVERALTAWVEEGRRPSELALESLLASVRTTMQALPGAGRD